MFGLKGTRNEGEPTVMGKLRVLDAFGDTVTDWTVEDSEAVREAEAIFTRMLGEEHRMAFARPSGAPSEEAEMIRTFDPLAEEILIVRPIQGG
jgi:hypothetical protein